MFPAARLSISILFVGSLFAIEVIAWIATRVSTISVVHLDVGRDSFDVDTVDAGRRSVDDDRVEAGRDDRRVTSASLSLSHCELDTHRYVTRRVRVAIAVTL